MAQLVPELEKLERQAVVCTDCRLCEHRTHVVFGAGDPRADVMIVGEGPGQQEDLQGLPFVGRSGHLLDRLLGEVGFDRTDVYISNVVKCRPPGNRDPRPDEIDACKHYLREQIEIIDPKVVITLGNFATKLLMREQRGITKLRGIAYAWWKRVLIPTFHPAAALRGGERVLQAMRDDMELVRQVVDGELDPYATTAPVTSEQVSPEEPRIEIPADVVQDKLF